MAVTALTLEQVLNKRFKLLQEIGAGMVLEVQAALAGSGLEALQAESLRGWLEATVLQREPAFFNDDDSFSSAVQKALKLKQEAESTRGVLW
jgi:hypothetical protein